MALRSRIIVLTFEFEPIYIGGLGTVLASLYGHLDPDLFQPVIVLPRSGYSLPEAPLRRIRTPRCDVEIHDHDGIEVQLLCNELLDSEPIYPVPDNWLGIKKIDEFGERVAELLPELRPDVLHLHDHYGYKALRDAQLRAIPTVYTVHRIHHEFNQWNLCEHVAVRLADRVTTVGHSYGREHADFFAAGRRPVAIIENGIDTAFWRMPEADESAAERAERGARLRARTGLAPGVTVAYLGRLNADQKGVDLLLDAFCRRLRDTDLRLLIIGQGDSEITGAIQQAAAETPDRVHFDNRVYAPADVRAVLGAVDMMVAPSRYEPFGLIQIEAMAMGAVPVVARTGGLGDVAIDVADDRGFACVFEPGDTHALATGLRRMGHIATTDPARFHAWRRRAMDQARDHSAEKMARAYAELYRSMIVP